MGQSTGWKHCLGDIEEEGFSCCCEGKFRGKGKMLEEVSRHPLRKPVIKMDIILQGGPEQDFYFFECNPMKFQSYKECLTLCNLRAQHTNGHLSPEGSSPAPPPSVTFLTNELRATYL